MSELKDCPFCGSKCEIRQQGSGWKAKCTSCCVSQDGTFTQRQHAVQEWNNRYLLGADGTVPDLKSCPYCGRSSDIRDTMGYLVTCNWCSASTGSWSTPSLAAEAWNRREA